MYSATREKQGLRERTRRHCCGTFQFGVEFGTGNNRICTRSSNPQRRDLASRRRVYQQKVTRNSPGDVIWRRHADCAVWTCSYSWIPLDGTLQFGCSADDSLMILQYIMSLVAPDPHTQFQVRPLRNPRNVTLITLRLTAHSPSIKHQC
jgi:hypothetical protein